MQQHLQHNNIVTFFSKLYSYTLNEQAVESYKKFLGVERLKTVTDRFKLSNFRFGNVRWNQVMTTRTTTISGTGLGASSVGALYEPILGKEGEFTVNNSGLGENFRPIGVQGTTAPRSKDFPTCRTVTFNSLNFTADYWILYISEDLKTVVVGSPLFIPGTSILVAPNFGIYVITQKTREDFWSLRDNVDEILNLTNNLGFTNFFNKPLPSGKSLLVDPSGATGAESN
jgi:hypothetical protein